MQILSQSYHTLAVWLLSFGPFSEDPGRAQAQLALGLLEACRRLSDWSRRPSFLLDSGHSKLLPSLRQHLPLKPEGSLEHPQALESKRSSV